uniref:SPX domain-containing protein n=1 Tax=Entomoneis paludosa TaxID=265537 RepID=A0A7S2YPT6_9STRA|mmetsp:Transcript_5132/g.10860  ORF Transcript_5132/g.10860 Transcript_5132/m.10860 type:complete len:414 (+) Transcript_5132:705-1946(+)|eukprot:CAMPEP_0172473172 /NCGR_PEP_ID=MMETSP1065-20121228/68718_1 /TAXON_ID=265537 /ORGANISM="Amphiprora paludosa, Strain CCMP125" /LENGTH=413 /DNA_ID=CAMNT_0013231341 /DNA_START=643 /DNA_END=1884 /DNA_ORIENTATION=-
MKFGKQLRDQTIKEWHFYSVDYKDMKKTLKSAETSGFFEQLSESEVKLLKFYNEKEAWATAYMTVLEDRVNELRQVEKNDDDTPTRSPSVSDYSMSSSEEDTRPTKTIEGPGGSDMTDLDGLFSQFSESASIKDAYRQMGTSKHFKAYIYAKKSLATFARELDLLIEFFSLNKTAFGKILKKHDKVTGSSVKEEKLTEMSQTLKVLEGSVFKELKEQVTLMIEETNELKPKLPRGWENRKVYTIGCFDLFHRGHQNVLDSLREFGYFLVAGIHDDESYFQLKGKYTIDNLETRMANIKPFVDQIFVIPSTDPQVYIQNMVSQQDIDTGACCYARGDDMLDFPSRPWVESVMPVHFVPRTEGCSSTLIRTIYHAPDETLRKKAAFAKTRYDGKPIDEDGNVLKLSAATNPIAAE